MKPAPAQQASLNELWKKKSKEDVDVDEGVMDIDTIDAGPSKGSLITSDAYHTYSWLHSGLENKTEESAP